MKTSNFLLILLFVISISLISAVPIMFNLKLKNGGNADNAYKWLYPYNKTIFPRGLPPAVLQFDGVAGRPGGSRAARRSSIEVVLVFAIGVITLFSRSGCDGGSEVARNFSRNAMA